MKQALLRAKFPEIARILNRSWEAKKKTASGVSTEHIEQMRELAFKEGALAGKISGAGGGGYMMLIVPPERRVNIIRALNDAGAPSTGVQLTTVGAKSWTLPTLAMTI